MRAHVYTRTTRVTTLVGWQVNIANLLVCLLSILPRRQKGCVYTTQPTLINNYEYVEPSIEHRKDLFCLFCLFVCFVALRPKSTAMVIAGRSVHRTTLFPRQA